MMYSLSLTSIDTQPTRDAWYLLQCKALQERRAEGNLLNQGYACFLPQIEVEKLRSSHRQNTTVPLFPGYLFIHLDTQADNWSPIRSTRGINRMIGFGGQPLPVPEHIIDALKVRVAQEPKVQALQAGDSQGVGDSLLENCH